MLKASEFGLASQISPTFDLGNDFDEVTANDDNGRTYSSSSIESNENSNRGNIAGTANINANTSGTKSR